MSYEVAVPKPGTKSKLLKSEVGIDFNQLELQATPVIRTFTL